MIGSVNNSVARLYTVASVQKNGVEQTQESLAKAKGNVKDMAVTVSISKQAKELMQTYANTYNNATDTANASSESSQTTSTVDTASLLEKVDKLQQRQVKQAFIENDSQRQQNSDNRQDIVRPTPLPAGSKVNEYA